MVAAIFKNPGQKTTMGYIELIAALPGDSIYKAWIVEKRQNGIYVELRKIKASLTWLLKCTILYIVGEVS